ncbi:hypothetical protein [Nocardiopsis sp. NPDC057823]|uniref:hypothetical protein n=1 Tax=Nocardiopsis sp. NPDC057823 TaxID=3346256 RepID=UPI003671351B
MPREAESEERLRISHATFLAAIRAAKGDQAATGEVPHGLRLLAGSNMVVHMGGWAGFVKHYHPSSGDFAMPTVENVRTGRLVPVEELHGRVDLLAGRLAAAFLNDDLDSAVALCQTAAGQGVQWQVTYFVLRQMAELVAPYVPDEEVGL